MERTQCKSEKIRGKVMGCSRVKKPWRGLSGGKEGSVVTGESR